MQIKVPKVNAAEASNFAKVWDFNGVALIIDDAHCKFAADFANVVLNSFVQNLMQQQAAEAQKSKIVIAES